MDEFDIGYKTYGKRRSLRLPDWDYRLPAVYHVTLTTYFRWRCFESPIYAGAFVDALREQVACTHYRIYAFCVMPDHVHLLCQPDTHHPVGLEEFILRVKGTGRTTE